MKNSIVTSPSGLAAERTPSAITSAVKNNLDRSRASSGLKVVAERPETGPLPVARPASSEPPAWASIKQDLRNAQGVLKVAISAADAGSILLSRLRETTADARRADTTAADRRILQSELTEIVDELRELIDDEAEFNGFNIVRDGARDLSVRTDIESGTLTIGARPIGPAALNLATLSLDTAENAAAADRIVVQASETVAAAMDSLEAESRKIDSQIKLTERFYDTANEGLGPIVNADLARESARLVAFQVEQQLSNQTSGIANQRLRSLLALF